VIIHLGLWSISRPENVRNHTFPKVDLWADLTVPEFARFGVGSAENSTCAIPADALIDLDFSV
jgi:hypothetical protein